MRQRMAGADPMGESSPGSGEQQPSGDPDQQTFFVKKKDLGGKTWKAGEEIVFKIKSMDPETGDAELYYAPEKGGEGVPEEPADAMTEMDKQFPAEEGGGGY